MVGVAIGDLRRLVIKIGSALLIDDHGRVNRQWLEFLAEDIHRFRQKGQQVLIVSSGAVAIGSQVLGFSVRRARLEELQAAAAAGQAQLVHAYQEALGSQNIAVAQVLLTPDDTEVRRRFLNARNTLEKLLEYGVVPVINENDTVATEELKYGDNDRLAARVAQIVMADGLILLSDIDGLYTADPRTNPNAEHIPLVREFDDALFSMAGQAGLECWNWWYVDQVTGGAHCNTCRLYDVCRQRCYGAPVACIGQWRQVHCFPGHRHAGGCSKAVAGWNFGGAR